MRNGQHKRGGTNGGGDSRRLSELVSDVVPPSCKYVNTVRVNQGDSDVDIILVVVQGTPCPSDRVMREKYTLTAREAEVARLLARRLSSREIAAELFISVNTARRHSERVLQKMGVNRRSDVGKVLLRLLQSREQA